MDSFQLNREDLEDQQRNLTTHRLDFTSLESQLKAISNEAEGIFWPVGCWRNGLWYGAIQYL